MKLAATDEVLGTSAASRTAGAGMWTIGSRLAAKVIDLIMLLLLARFLQPSDFGLVAIAMATVFVAEALFELPTAAALIRIPKITSDLLNTAFTLSLLRGLLISVMLLVASAPLAAFNNDWRLVSLLAVLSLAPAFRGLCSPRLVEYTRKMDFRPDVVIELSGKTAALILSVAIAVLTGSYWAIAAASVMAPLVGTVLSYFISPLRPRLTLARWKDFSNLIGWNFVSQFFSALNWQIDRLLLPRFTTGTVFGHYAMGKQLSEIPIQAFVAPLARPTMAALASSGDHGASRYLQISQALSLVLVPVFGLCIIWPEIILRVSLGKDWIAASEWLRWVTAATLLNVPTMLLAPLAMAKNQTRWLATRTGMELLLRMPLVWFGAVHYGIPGAIGGSAIANVFGTFIALVAVKRIIGSNFILQLSVIGRPFLAMLPASAFLFFAEKSMAEAASVIQEIAFLFPCLILYFLIYGIADLFCWVIAGKPAGLEFLVAQKVTSVYIKTIGNRSSKV